MPEEIVPSPAPQHIEQPSAPLESDLSRVATEFAKHRENPEMSGLSDREVVKQALHSVTGVPAPAPQSVTSTPSDDSVLPTYMVTATPAAKLELEDLVRMAFKEGIAKAAHTAEKSNPFILDAFHDTMAGNLHEELKKRKLI